MMMFPILHLMLLYLSLARTETSHKDSAADDFVYDHVIRHSKDWRFGLQQSEDGSDPPEVYPSYSTYFEHGKPSTASSNVMKRRLLRSDLGKRYYDNSALYSQGLGGVLSNEVASNAGAFAGGDYDKDDLKRSNEHILKLWHLKEGWKKRPMLRGDLGKRQMIRSDLG